VQPGSRLGPYEIIASIGAGGMGEVYRARDTRLGRDVAIKVLPAEFASDPERLRRFEQEARAVAALDHPNILALYDVGTHEGAPYIVTQLLEGESLRERLQAGSLTPRKAIEVGAEIAQGLAAAHDKGIIHRDLKPWNVFITKDGHVKILDFGLAKLVAPRSVVEPAQASTVVEATEAGTALGTVGYMPPEQVRGQVVDQRSDIFSFGCVMYEMLSGRPPFRRDTAADTTSAILHEEPAELSRVATGVPAALERVVRRCLEKEPDERYQSSRDVGFALLEASGAAEASTPPMVRVRVGWRKRPLVAVAIGISVLVAVAAGLLFRRNTTPAPQPAGPSVAVLPFVNLSGDKEQEYFSDGLSEELMGLLAKVKELHVVGRLSSFAFKEKKATLTEIGRELHVATVLEGSVRRSGDRLRVATQLVSVADGFQIWSETYDRTMTDVFAMQDEIAVAVVAALRPALVPLERPVASAHQTANPEAYTQYLLGRHLYELNKPESWRQAVEAYESAVRLDPAYAAAYAGLAIAEIGVAGYSAKATERAEWKKKALDAAEKAITLDPMLAAGYAARGHLRSIAFPPDWVAAHSDLRHALELDPSDVGARIHACMLLALLDRLPEAVAEARKATDLDPLSPTAWSVLGWCLNAARDLAGARQALNRVLEISPDDFISHWNLGCTSLLEGNPTVALREFARTTEVSRLTGSALAEHDLGHTKASQAALDELIAKHASHAAYQIGEVYAWRSELDKAFEWLNRAYAQSDYGLCSLKPNPLLARLRSDRRYDDLLRRMNYPTSASP
jgi:serine/threonine-protein kinase